MRGGKRHRTYLIGVGLAIFLSACATSGGGSVVKQNVPLRNLGITTQGKHARIEVVDVIQPGDPSSWVEDARWTEVVVRITNTSKSYLFGRDCQLVNANGAMIPVAQHPMMLADIQEQVSKSLAEEQLKAAAAQAATQALYPVIMQSYTSITSAVASSPYLGAVLSFAGGLFQQQQATAMASAANRPQEVMRELERRAFQPGAGVVPGGQMQGSFFFPYTRAAQKLVFSYEAGGGANMVEVPLARATAEVNVKVESAVLRTDEEEVHLGAATAPVTLRPATNLIRLGVSFSRDLSPLEIKNLRAGFTGSFPCTKPERVDVSEDGKSVLLFEYPDGCLRGTSGSYDLVVAGLNIHPAVFPIHIGDSPKIKRTTVESPNPYVEVIVNTANIREEPKVGRVIRAVSKGTRLEKIDQVGNWTKVLVGGEQVGWIASGVVKEVPGER